MNDKITPHTRLAVLKHLVKGKSPEVVAAAERLDRFEVIDIGSHHGYPDTAKMARAIEMITTKLVEAEQSAPQPSAPRPSTPPRKSTPQSSASAAVAPTSTPNGVHSAQPEGEDDDVTRTVAAGKRSASKRVQALAARIENDVERLQRMLDEEQARLEAARRSAEAKAELRQKKEQLERELAAVKAKLRGGAAKKPATSTKHSDAPAAKDIRTWARSVGIECPATGRVPQAVREAYDAAHAASAA